MLSSACTPDGQVVAVERQAVTTLERGILAGNLIQMFPALFESSQVSLYLDIPQYCEQQGGNNGNNGNSVAMPDGDFDAIFRAWPFRYFLVNGEGKLTYIARPSGDLYRLEDFLAALNQN